MDFGGYCAFTYPSQSQPEHPHTCTVTCTTTRRIGTNPAQPSPFSTILFNPTHPMPDAVGRTGQIACSAATHLIHRLQYCFFGLPTCSSLVLATGCCRPAIGLWERAIPRTVEKRNGEDLEGVGTGPGPETGERGTGTHLIDFCTLNSNDGGPIADSTSRKHIACTSLLYRRRTLINQGCQSHSVPSPLSFSLFFRLLQRPEILHRLFPTSSPAFHALVRDLRLVPRHRYFRPPEANLLPDEPKVPQTTSQRSQEGRKDQPKPPNSRRATILLQNFQH